MFDPISFANIILRIPERVSDISISSFLPLLPVNISHTLPIENKAMTTTSAIKNANRPFPIRDNITNENIRYIQIDLIIMEGNNFAIRSLDFSSYLIIGFSNLFFLVIFYLL